MVDSIDKMYAMVESAARTHGLEQTKRALVLMAHYHAGQFRKGPDRLPYIIHPLTMACHALSLQLIDDDLLSVCLLHDVVEDCDVAPEALDVGETVQAAVKALTFERGAHETKHEAKLRYFLALREHPLAALVKALDRCNNVSQMATGFTHEKIREYILETEEMVLPMMEDTYEHVPEYREALFALNYQITSILVTIKAFI